MRKQKCNYLSLVIICSHALFDTDGCLFNLLDYKIHKRMLELPFLPICNPVHISLRLLIIDQIFLLSQVKERVIISRKHGICELLNDLRLEILGN